MDKSSNVIPHYSRIMTKIQLANNPPSSHDIMTLKRCCQFVQTTEAKIRLFAIVGLVLGPLVALSFSAGWGDLGIAMLLTGVCYFGVVSITPKVIRLFYDVSFKVDGQELVDAMNSELFRETNHSLRTVAMSNLAKTYVEKLGHLNRRNTVFDLYIVHLLNEDGQQTGHALMKGMAV